jgi:phospholipid/cholesterol/gamma-HCH transport system substrate-binding protein
MGRRTLINLGFFSLVALVFFFWALTNLVKVDPIQRPYKISGTFASAVGLLPGAEVDYLGVTFGTVSNVSRTNGGAAVEMKINRGKRIPRDSTAAIFRKSALGEQYIDFTPPPGYGGTGGPYYVKGARIPLAKTSIPLEFSELLRSASRLVGAIPPEALNTLVHEAAVGLQGRADSLRQFTQAGDTLSQSLVTRTAALDRLATNNTRLTRVFAEHREAFGRSLTDLREVADSLRNAKGNTSVLLARGAALLDQAASLIHDHKGDLDCDLKTLELVTDITTTPNRLAGLATVLDVAPTAFDQFLDATDLDPNPPIGAANRRWVRVGFKVNATYNKAPQFVPPKVLPPVRAVPACLSPVRAQSLSYRPISATTADGPELPMPERTLVTLGLVLLAALLVLRFSGPSQQRP